VRHSQSKNLPYYFNAVEKVSRWEPPQDTDTEKLKNYMAAYHSNKGPAAGAGAGGEERQAGKIRAAHLLVKHRDSRRPSSWRENTITRSKEEALEILQAHERRIRGGDISLGQLALTESDCSSARKHGDLGYFGHGDMQKEFEDAAFALRAGEISGIVDTASGLHLIERCVDSVACVVLGWLTDAPGSSNFDLIVADILGRCEAAAAARLFDCLWCASIYSFPSRRKGGHGGACGLR
jgi:NIMA-interacting peptidyl-prolyl cis-trans isomerase 1